MPIETICQGCARKLRVPDEHAGKKARCPQCGLIYVVPSSPYASSSSSDEGRSSDSYDSFGAREKQDAAREEAAQAATSGSSVRDVERWQVRTSDGRVYGPVPREELDQWYQEGRIPADASLLREGDPQWHNATDVYPQLGGGGSGSRQSLSERDNPFAETSTPRASSSPFRTSPARYRTPHRGGVILTLAILGWAICPVFGPFAWAMGHSDIRAMRLGQMDPAGQSLTQAGMIIGMIQTLIVAFVFALACLGALG